MQNEGCNLLHMLRNSALLLKCHYTQDDCCIPRKHEVSRLSFEHGRHARETVLVAKGSVDLTLKTKYLQSTYTGHGIVTHIGSYPPVIYVLIN